MASLIRREPVGEVAPSGTRAQYPEDTIEDFALWAAGSAASLVPSDPSLPTGYPPFGLPIKPHVNWVTVARNDAGNIELFYAQDTPDAPLIHMTLDQDTGDWEERR